MRRSSRSALIVAVALLITISQPVAAGAAGVAVTRPALSRTTGITTAMKLTARGWASPLPTTIRSASASLVLSRRSSTGTYVKAKSTTCTLTRSGLRVNYRATFGPLSAGRYSASARFRWVGTDGKVHVAVSTARFFGVAAPVASRTWDVLEKDFTFVPSTLAVSVGDKIVFTNKDSAPHQVFIDGKNLALQVADASVTWVAPRSGTFPFSCVVHPSMTGQLTVR